jgi:hypothetical protein
MSKLEFINFLESQKLNGLRAEHVKNACAVLIEMGVKDVPSQTKASGWISRMAWSNR